MLVSSCSGRASWNSMTAGAHRTVMPITGSSNAPSRTDPPTFFSPKHPTPIADDTQAPSRPLRPPLPSRTVSSPGISAHLRSCHAETSGPQRLPVSALNFSAILVLDAECGSAVGRSLAPPQTAPKTVSTCHRLSPRCVCEAAAGRGVWVRTLKLVSVREIVAGRSSIAQPSSGRMRTLLLLTLAPTTCSLVSSSKPVGIWPHSIAVSERYASGTGRSRAVPVE
eukprot:scaffold241841_cov26-Tisochrysis_lutea.AAC.1